MAFNSALGYDPEDIFAHWFDEPVEQFIKPEGPVIPWFLNEDQRLPIYAEFANSILVGYEAAHKALFHDDYKIIWS